jgi:ribonuclease G
MNERNFSRRRRGGMRFRPNRGNKPGDRPNRAAQEARKQVLKPDQGQQGPERIFDQSRVTKEIDRAENVAAGLPPDATPETEVQAQDDSPNRKGRFREPNLETPAEVSEENFEPVTIVDKPKGLVQSLKSAATKVIKKVQRVFRPLPKSHKEVIINAESLETRVAVLETGRLEEFTIERNTEERLVGSIF